MGFGLKDLNPIKAGKKLVKKSLDLGKDILPALLAFGTAGGGWAGAAAAGSTFLNQMGVQDANKQDEQLRAENIALQREFAQNGVRWRVADAKAAGINPLAALGMQGASYQSQVGNFQSPYSEMGQDISRAIMAKATREERNNIAAANALQLRNLELQNQGLAIDNAAALSQFVRQRELPPPMPTVRVSKVKGTRMGTKTVIGDRTRPHENTTVVPSVGWSRTQYGFQPIPSAEYKAATEDMGYELEWYINNALAPRFNPGARITPPDSLKPANHVWRYNAVRNTYYSVPREVPAHLRRGYIPPGH